MNTNNKLLQQAAEAAGKVCFDASATKSVCISRALNLKVEIDKMVQAIRCGKVTGASCSKCSWNGKLSECHAGPDETPWLCPKCREAAMVNV